jgi:error-prone DNA polymerase
VSFIELRSHSAFSFGDGTATPEALVRRAAELGYPALGLSDNADLGGTIRFVLESERQGIRPVVGAELLVDGYPCALLARNEEGYRNLSSLVTLARVGNFKEQHQRIEPEPEPEPESSSLGSPRHRDAPRHSRPRSVSGSGSGSGSGSKKNAVRSGGWRPETSPGRGQPGITFTQLAERSAGLYALTGPATGELACLIGTGRKAESHFALDRWRDAFAERLAVEVQLHHVSGTESALVAALIELAERTRVRWVVSNDARYLDGSGRLVHDLLTALRAGVDVNTAASWGVLLPNGEWRLKSPREMQTLWHGRERGLDASHEIALDCNFDLHWLRPPLPAFPVPHGHNDDSYLAQLVFAGAHTRWGEVDERQRGQLDHELRVIRKLGFSGFFLVMWDAIRYAREQGILCQGRGSAANSAVAYCLAITSIDPVKHGLLFERFLSEVRTDGRTEAPDIDVDFEMHRREEVLDYMYEKYRRQHAAITAVTQAFHAPTAIQDMMRALGYPAELAFRLSKRTHGQDPSLGAEMLEQGLAKQCGLDLNDARARALLGCMKVLDDVPRLRSTHPGGFVLSAQPLGSYIPIEHTTMGRTILQFDKDDLDAAGVPKFDFLGLGGLSAVHMAFDAIEKRTGEKLEMYRLPTDDAVTYEMISHGDTVGTFQIESRAQISSILQTRPDRLYDIVVQVALIRPGPIQARFVHPYTMRRRGLEPVRYAHPLLEPILARTYGIPIFQEQAMSVAMALGGFTAAEADELRRAMGHRRKLPRLHAALDRLKERCIARGVEESIAAEVVEDLHSFANYGFPESHAWSFALIAYATAYLKARYPTEFYLGMLNAWPMGFYPPATLVHDAMRHGVIVRGPCLRVGEWDCTIEPVSASPDDGGHVTDSPQRHGAGAEARRVKQQSVGTLRNSAITPCLGGESVPRLCSESVNDASAAPVLEPALRVGWRHIRGLGEKARTALQEAHAQGPFTSIEDVIRRAQLTRADALHLARAGAFEAFQPGRRKAAWEALRAAGDLLPLAPARMLPFDPAELAGEELIFLDYLATGISVNGHPMEHLRERLMAAGVSSNRDLQDAANGERITVAGLVVARQHPETAKGTVFLLLEDEFGFSNVIVPRHLYEKNREVVKFSPFLLCEGRVEREERVVNVVGRTFRELGAGRITFRSHDFH